MLRVRDSQRTLHPVAALILILAACGQERDARHAASEPEVPSRALTHWTDQTELFVEFPALVAGRDAPFAVHLTRLADFKPVAAGKVAVVLSGGGLPDERFEAGSPVVPGIFRPVARPQRASRRRLSVQLESAELRATHELGEIQVFENLVAARKAMPAEEKKPGLISFLKEQQWRTEFATDVVRERTLRPSIPLLGQLRARPDGEVHITAPAAGRLLNAGKDFPRIGAPVRANQLLAALAPQLTDGADPATLELAVTQAELDADRAVRERARIEAARSDGVVAERRVLDARHDEATARARLDASRQRLSLFSRLQRPAGSGVRGIEIRSPIAGTLAAVHVAPGAFVEANREMFHVVDLGRLWLEVRVPEANLGRLSSASGAWFEVEGFQGAFEIPKPPLATGGVVDPRSRTLPFVFELDNPEQRLPAGMSVRAHVLTGQPIAALAAPLPAVLSEGGQDVVYVQVEGESFERRAVELGARDGQYVQVRAGLSPGEHVVVRGAYAVKLASSSTQPPAHGHAH